MKKLCFTVALMAIALTVCAQAISQQEAMERANSFLNSALKARHQTSSNTQLDAVTVDLHHLKTHQYWQRWGAKEFYRDEDCVDYKLDI